VILNSDKKVKLKLRNLHYSVICITQRMPSDNGASVHFFRHNTIMALLYITHVSPISITARNILNVVCLYRQTTVQRKTRCVACNRIQQGCCRLDRGFRRTHIPTSTTAVSKRALRPDAWSAQRTGRTMLLRLLQLPSVATCIAASTRSIAIAGRTRTEAAGCTRVW